MKRHPDLLQRSREHYGALKLARDARRAAESGAVAALATPDADTLLRFAELLGAHVRFEEREVFEAAQARLDIGIMYLGYLAIIAQLLIEFLGQLDGSTLLGAASVHLFTFGAMG